jgi:hypothetical protein
VHNDKQSYTKKPFFSDTKRLCFVNVGKQNVGKANEVSNSVKNVVSALQALHVDS